MALQTPNSRVWQFPVSRANFTQATVQVMASDLLGTTSTNVAVTDFPRTVPPAPTDGPIQVAPVDQSLAQFPRGIRHGISASSIPAPPRSSAVANIIVKTLVGTTHTLKTPLWVGISWIKKLMQDI
jgi:hypothetical protein